MKKLLIVTLMFSLPAVCLLTGCKKTKSEAVKTTVEHHDHEGHNHDHDHGNHEGHNH